MNLIELKNLLKKEVFEKKYVLVGPGMEEKFGVSRLKFRIAIVDLRTEGYTVYYIPSGKLSNNGSRLALKVLSSPLATYEEVYINQDLIKEPDNHI